MASSSNRKSTDDPTKVGNDGTAPGEPAVSTEGDLAGQNPTVATPDAGHEDQVPTVEPEGISSPDDPTDVLHAGTEFVDVAAGDDPQQTARDLLAAAEKVGADVEREVRTVDGGFAVSERVADAYTAN